MYSQNLKMICEELNLPKFRYRQICKAVYKDYCNDYSVVSVLPKKVREQLQEKSILSLTPEKVYISSQKNCYKALLKLQDGRYIESVLMSPKKGLWTTCISSQVGCALDCSFCATGKMGLVRHLTVEEICDQVLFWLQYIQKMGLEKLNNIVYMGMGEPFHNSKVVFESLSELINPDLFGFASRSISVSTSGLIPEIEKFVQKFPQVNLAVSLHSAIDEKRSELMPINRRYDLKALHKVLEKTTLKNKRKIFVEYVLIQGQNDAVDDAVKLAEYVHSFSLSYLFQINLIVYNDIKADYQESIRARQFKNFLLEQNLSVTIRKNLGRDINGACGQLIWEQEKQSINTLSKE